MQFSHYRSVIFTQPGRRYISTRSLGTPEGQNFWLGPLDIVPTSGSLIALFVSQISPSTFLVTKRRRNWRFQLLNWIVRSCVDCFDAADSPFYHLLFPWGQSHLSHHSHVSIPEMEMIIIVMMMVAMINDWCWSGDKMVMAMMTTIAMTQWLQCTKCCLYSIFSSLP